MADFASWVTVVGNRYAGKVKYWFVRNEPEFGGADSYEFVDTAAKYAEMTRIASQILKSIDPTNKIMGCEMVGLSKSTTTFTNFANASAAGYDAGFGTGAATTGKDWIDLVSTHTYNGSGSSGVVQELNNVSEWQLLQRTMKTLGIDKPIWSTEFMYTGSDDVIEVEKMKRNAVVSLAYSDMWIWFGWGRGAAMWNKNNAVGVEARRVWDEFTALLFSSPIVDITMNKILLQIEVTQENGNKFVV